MRLEARAKINWTLDIVGQRPDGYHLMDMLMQPVTLSDTLSLELANELSLSLEGASNLPADERNLVWRAAAALREATGCRLGAEIHLVKRVPSGAGMGGGSADAAAALTGLNRLWELGLTQEELERIGLGLGADIPFCLRGGLCRVRGIGERIQPVPCARDYELVVIQPCEGLSTGEVFRDYHVRDDIRRPCTDAAERALAAGDSALLARSLGNVLQPVSEAKRPLLREAITDLTASGALAAQMTGSGSAVFGVYETAAGAEVAWKTLSIRWGAIWRCRTCAESMVETSDEQAF